MGFFLSFFTGLFELSNLNLMNILHIMGFLKSGFTLWTVFGRGKKVVKSSPPNRCPESDMRFKKSRALIMIQLVYGNHKTFIWISWPTLCKSVRLNLQPPSPSPYGVSLANAEFICRQTVLSFTHKFFLFRFLLNIVTVFSVWDWQVTQPLERF